MPKRPNIPLAVRLEVLVEAGYRCAVPACRTILAIDLHHLEQVAAGGKDTADNLLALCPTCHGLHHRGTIPVEALVVWKGLLVSLNEGVGKEARELLLFLDLKIESIYFKSDAILKMAGLIVSGLVSVSPVGGTGPGNSFVYENYQIVLTTKGRSLVTAWKAGDRHALAVAQNLGRLP